MMGGMKFWQQGRRSKGVWRSNALLRSLGVVLLLSAGNGVSAQTFCSAPSGTACVILSSSGDLRFGTFVATGPGGSASRTVAPNGNLTASANTVAMSGDLTGASLFTVTVIPNGANPAPQKYGVQINLPAGSIPFTKPNSSGTVSAVTWLITAANGATPSPLSGGTSFTLAMPASCRNNTTCSVSFAVGGKLDVTTSSGGASLAIPVPVTATLVTL